MFEGRKKYLVGIVICGATYYGVRWLYYYYCRGRSGDTPPTIQVRQIGDTKKRKRVNYASDFGQGDGRFLYDCNLSESAQLADTGSVASATSTWTVKTSRFFDVEPNIHFFKIFQDELEVTDAIPVPRSDRTEQLFCESRQEFLAKVSCLRKAFNQLISVPENNSFFISSGKEILTIFLSHSPSELAKCLATYEQLLAFVSDPSNYERIEAELATRNIPVFSFYDLVVDYIILESLDDLDDPPAVVSSIVSNTWVSSKFRRSACQSAVATALKFKRSRLKSPDGLFAHFYSLLDYLSPTLAWGFLGSDDELQVKCGLLKECLVGLCRDYFSFDRVRYTSYEDLCEDLLACTRERYYDLTDRLSQ